MTAIDAVNTANGNGIGIADKMIRGAIQLVVATAAAVGLYFAITTKLDELSKDVNALKMQLAQSLKPDDLRMFCLEAQIRNKGWTCPLVEQPKAPAVRVTPARPAAP